MWGRILISSIALISLTACQEARTSANSAPSNTAGSAPAAGYGARPMALVSFADAVGRAAPAVVTIRSERRVQAPEQFPFAKDPFFRRFFGLPGAERGGRPPVEVEHALGSGVIVRADGYILTNHHVVNGAEEIKVDLNDHRTLAAKVIGSDPPSDPAVLKINAEKLPALVPADSDKVRVGDVCLALGNPLGIGQTVTSGIISAKGRSTGLSNGSFEDFLQTDAPSTRETRAEP